MTVISVLLGIGIALGPPLAYSDQIYSIFKKQSSYGFNTEICCLLVHANILRIFYYFGGGFDSTPLLIQSFVMILAQLGLQYLCVRYPPLPESGTSAEHDNLEAGYEPRRDQRSKRHTSAKDDHATSSAPANGVDLHYMSAQGEEDEDELDITDSPDAENEAMIKGSTSEAFASEDSAKEQRTKRSRKVSSRSNTESGPSPAHFPEDFNPVETRTGRPFNFWKWETFSPYLGYSAGFVLVMIPLNIFLGSFGAYVTVLGILSLSLETVLPLPALFTITRNQSSEGFRLTVPLTWLFGDCYKTVYYFTTEGNSLIFKLSAIILIIGDSSVLLLSAWYGTVGERIRGRLRR